MRAVFTTSISLIEHVIKNEGKKQEVGVFHLHVVQSICGRFVTVTGTPHTVMALIGALAAHGDDGLITADVFIGM